MAARGRIARICRTLGVGVPIALTLAGAIVASTNATTLVRAVASPAPAVMYANGGFEWG